MIQGEHSQDAHQRQDAVRDQRRPSTSPDPSVIDTVHPNDPPPLDFDPVYPLDVPIARPTLAPITLAFGLFLLALGGLVGQWWVMGIGAAVAIWAGATWIHESLVSST